ncbi:MAG: chemotaxis protein CheB [Candidatus Thorarchaeota archaeon]
MVKRVLIASESAFRRIFLSEMLGYHEEIIIIGSVRNANEAIDKMENVNLDVLILDIEFENRDWIKQFYPVINGFPIKTIILSDKNLKLMDTTNISINLNSDDYVIKPIGVWKDELPKIRDKIVSKILMIEIPIEDKIDNKTKQLNKTIFIKQNQKIRATNAQGSNNIIKPTIESRSEEYFLDLSPVSINKLDSKIVVIGASVGGPRTLRSIFSEIPKGFPAPILVVQHLNHLFMRQFVISLRDICKVDVKIGLNYEEIHPGIIYFSPGDKHMQVTVKNDKPCVRTFEGEPVNFCRPSVDVLFYSTARIYKEKTLGILLTGMGRDGVNGLHAIKYEGGKTIAESEETSVLYGMPKVAAETGAADLIIPNYKIVEEMINFVN